ncbi:pyruvate kinase [Anaeromicropila herbilytica]|uniref:Pyruvate kinase n=1 Tax=Anaeromicropila herbilytica TaxID=2785025 RepID=A0A7R7ID22_9FIRM|nr:pyruvate kinase [Anaeromicropila herbilytica]BCN30456.1 pyruvate kinase [Anaeromicropila herbilytica]
MKKKTKIVCTMGPNTDSKDMLRQYALSGMDIARLNFSHDTHEGHLKRINYIKELREELGLPLAILLDTKGPEIRTCLLENEQKVTLEIGQEFTFTTEDIIGNKSIVAVTYQDLPKDVKAGDIILIDDGLIACEVKTTTATEVKCTVLNGGELGNRKGINIPNVSVNLPALTQKDKDDIIFGMEQGIDFIAASFVRNAEAVREIKALVKEHNADVAIIAKIENQEGIQNIDEIIDEADGIMVARGDMGVEVPAEMVPAIQKEIIKKCNEAFKPVITATQMLDSMIRNPRPTRAEVTDVANAIYDGTDAIMLSGESAMGKYPVEAISMMVKIATETEAHLDFDAMLAEKENLKTKSVSNAVSFASVTTAKALNSKLIVASSMSGYTTRLVSKFRPKATIIGLSPCDKTLRKMQILWGVKPVKATEEKSTDAILEKAVETVKASNYAESGDTLVFTAGVPAGKTGVTNMMKVAVID